MIKEILRFYNKKGTESSSAFSDFFTESSSGEKKRVIKETARDANEDQKNLADRYNKTVNSSEVYS